MYQKGRASSLLPTLYIYLVGERRKENTSLKFLPLTPHLEVGLGFYTSLKLVPFLGLPWVALISYSAIENKRVGTNKAFRAVP